MTRKPRCGAHCFNSFQQRQKTMSDQTTDITSKSQLSEIMSEDGPPALIDFWAPWCGPCKMMAPAYEDVAEAFADEPIEFYKIDTQAHPELSEPFHVQSIPTLILVDGGEILDNLIGAQSEAQLKKRAEWLLSKHRGEGFLKRLFG